jgi:hypothetical protein
MITVNKTKTLHKKYRHPAPPHPAFSPETGGEGKGEGEISNGRYNSPPVHSWLYYENHFLKAQDCAINHFDLSFFATIGKIKGAFGFEL